MMAAHKHTPSLIERLPAVRGRYSADAALSKITWFKVGGPAEVMFRPADADDLSTFLAAKPSDVAVTVIGVASNLLVRDGGVRGVVVRLGRGFADVKCKDMEIHVGAAALDVNVAAAARDAGVGGMEFLSGIPGTIGGALRMNAGAFGSEIKDCVVSVKALDGNGAVHDLAPDDMNFAYRHCGAAEDWIFVSAVLRGHPEDKDAIARRIAEIAAERQAGQPLRTPTGGSTFANPPGMKAWELIDRAGCRGLRRGGAVVSEKHCNFLINTGDATAADLEGLGEEIRRRVFAACGVRLQWEIRRLGVPDLSQVGEA